MLGEAVSPSRVGEALGAVLGDMLGVHSAGHGADKVGFPVAAGSTAPAQTTSKGASHPYVGIAVSHGTLT